METNNTTMKTKSELLSFLAEKTNVAKKDVTAIFDAYKELLIEQLNGGLEVRLPDIGKFKIKDVKARTGRNPATGEEIQISASKKIRFVVAKEIKDNLK